MAAAPMTELNVSLGVGPIHETCAVAGVVGGQLRSRALPASELAYLLGTRHDLTRPSPASTLSFEVFRASRDGSDPLLLGCILPSGARGEPLRALVASAVLESPAAVLRTLLLRGMPDLGPDLARSAWQRIIGELFSGSATTAVGVVLQGPSASPGSAGYVPAGTPPTPWLPTVEVWGTSTQWIINVTPLYDAVRDHWSIGDLINWDWHLDSGPNCAHASELWQLQDEEAQRLEDNVDFLRMLTTSLAGAACDSTVSNLPWCIDLFIQASRAFIFAGDDRTFDPDAGWRRSRVQFYFNPDGTTPLPHWTARITESRLFFGPNTDVGYQQFTHLSPPNPGALFDPAQDVSYSVEGDSVRIRLAFRNSYCLGRNGCPATDAFLWFVRDATAPGGWAAYWKRDGFPSMQINFKNAQGAWTENARDAEDQESGWLAMIGNLRQHNTLPWPCEHQ